MHLVNTYNITLFLPVGKDWITPIDFIKKLNEKFPLMYGDYDQNAWFSAEGSEHFRPLEGSEPEYGNINESTHLGSFKVELHIKKDDNLRDQILKIIQELHPWEEPVIRVTSCQTTISQ